MTEAKKHVTTDISMMFQASHAQGRGDWFNGSWRKVKMKHFQNFLVWWNKKEMTANNQKLSVSGITQSHDTDLTFGVIFGPFWLTQIGSGLKKSEFLAPGWPLHHLNELAEPFDQLSVVHTVEDCWGMCFKVLWPCVRWWCVRAPGREWDEPRFPNSKRWTC